MSRKPSRPEPGVDGASEAADEAEVRRALRARAMGLLARREHSRHELARKLARGAAGAAETVTAVVDELTDQGLQSDARFVDALARRRADMGYGPLRLVAELREHGLEAEAGEGVFDVSDPHWSERARQARVKRFGDETPTLAREVARQLRFLQYRGFTSAQARRALDARDDND